MEIDLTHIGESILALIDYFFVHLNDKEFLLYFIVTCFILLALSIYQSKKQIYKEGGMLDIHTQKLAAWEPFYFIEKYLDIKPLKRIRFRDLFNPYVREKYFYTEVAKKLNMSEFILYTRVQEKIDAYESELYQSISYSILALLFIPLFPFILQAILSFTIIIYLYVSIFKLNFRPLRKELLPLQKNILEQMFKYLFKKNYLQGIGRLSNVDGVNDSDNSIDLEKVFIDINKRIDNRSLQIN